MNKEIQKEKNQLSEIALIPNWKDGEYHDYYATGKKLKDLMDKFPDLINVFSIGKSVLGRDIQCMKITNENNNTRKFSCLIDGCIHGSEWESGEACLYLSEYLLINYKKNQTVTQILDNAEVYLVPLVNPDGRQKDQRWNENCIDLNRNFNVHFGRILGGNLPIALTNKIRNKNFSHMWLLTNSGQQAFSEPETKSIRNLVEKISSKDLSFYVNCHTAMQKMISPSTVVFKPEFKVTKHENIVLNNIKDWIQNKTNYKNDKRKKFFGCGNACDWIFKEYRIPSFIFEILSKEYMPGFKKGKHDHLVYWMKTTLPVFMYLLTNIENIYHWKIPDIEPLLPE